MPRLTDTLIRAAQPPVTGQRTLTDEALPNFGLRVSQGGSKTFTVTLGKGKRHTIGRYPLVSLADARKEARRILAERELGVVRPTFTAWDDAKAAYLAACAVKNRPLTVRDYTRHLAVHFPFGRRAIADITQREVVRQLSHLPPSEKHHAFTAARAFFKWCVREAIIDRSPMENMATPHNGMARSRILTDAEIKALWAATEPAGTFHTIVRLLILTGQRRGEVAALQWDWIDTTERTITIPAAVTKNGRLHSFPYGDMVAEVLARIDRFEGVPYLFPASRQRSEATTVFNSWSKAKAALDKASVVTGYTLHDCRRTYSSTMARLGVPQIVVERLLNHATGSLTPIAAVYNRYTYMTEMRDACKNYEHHIHSLVG